MAKDIGIEKIFKDASHARVITSSKFLEELQEKISKSNRYRAEAAGILEVEGTDGIKRSGEHYFIVSADLKGEKVQLLFELTEGEASRVVGCNLSKITEEKLRKIIDSIAEGKNVNEVKLLI